MTDPTTATPPANRWLRGALIVIALLLMIIVFLTWRVATGAEPVAAPSPTPTRATPTPTPSLTPTPTPTPTPTESSAPAPPAATPKPPPPPAGPAFTSFAVSPLSPDCSSASSVELTFAWSSTGATAGWIGVATTNAKTAPYDSVNPASGSYVLSYQCSEPSQTYTVTLEDSSGKLTHKTVTISRTPAS